MMHSDNCVLKDKTLYSMRQRSISNRLKLFHYTYTIHTRSYSVSALCTYILCIPGHSYTDVTPNSRIQSKTIIIFSCFFLVFHFLFLFYCGKRKDIVKNDSYIILWCTYPMHKDSPQDISFRCFRLSWAEISDRDICCAEITFGGRWLLNDRTMGAGGGEGESWAFYCLLVRYGLLFASENAARISLEWYTSNLKDIWRGFTEC